MKAPDVAAYLVEFVKIVRDSQSGITGMDANQTLFQAHPELSDSARRDIKTAVSFARSDCRAVGWLHLNEELGLWRITERGKKALEQYPNPNDFRLAAKRLRKNPPTDDGQTPNGADKEIVEQAVATQEASSTFETARDAAQESIANYLLTMDEHIFQDVVADLLIAMGYHVDWVSPPGADGGSDVVAFSDSLGVTKPIIKVQVKRWKSKIGAPDLKSFAANIMDNESGICVCLGGFTYEAERFARESCNKNLTLIALNRFVQLWIENYDKLTDKAKKRFRLEPIYFVRPDTE